MPSPQPVVFIHGLWVHASSWQPWIDLFEHEGYTAVAPLWPGEHDSVEASRAHAHDAADKTIDDVVSHFQTIADSFDVQPILIGHSFGGLIVEKLLGQGYGAAGVAIDPAQIKGVLPLPLNQLRSSLPVLSNPGNLHKAVSLTEEQWRFSFGNALSADESSALWNAWNIPSPARPLFQAAVANFALHSEAEVATGNDDRAPLLLIAGGRDHTVPETVVDATLRQYRDSNAVTELITFTDRGHSLTIDHGWNQLATEILIWLRQQSLAQ
ncbi:alpha/beta hydrolase [Agreia sp. Leaf210]|uniref:alpha/beta hydrolase n=1 Tax=Agreia sp. Leaf210 TaxID=1735682 RepID=UPI0006FDED23|nr:alpha/beta fold hydrolase [Agreia sp. Leaf210]KQM59508.1 alpha/beta hydrolase [Agreia sp. Leaf210]